MLFSITEVSFAYFSFQRKVRSKKSTVKEKQVKEKYGQRKAGQSMSAISKMSFSVFSQPRHGSVMDFPYTLSPIF